MPSIPPQAYRPPPSLSSPMSTAVELAPHGFGLHMGDTMAIPRHDWSNQDVLYHRRHSNGVCELYPHDSTASPPPSATSASTVSPAPAAVASNPHTPRERGQFPDPLRSLSAATSSSPPFPSPHSRSSAVPPVIASRDTSHYSSSSPSRRHSSSCYYSSATGEYATPSPVSQTPPQLPAPPLDISGIRGAPGGRNPRSEPDLRLSPTHSTTSSDRSEEPNHIRPPHHPWEYPPSSFNPAHEVPACQQYLPSAPTSSPSEAAVFAYPPNLITPARSVTYPPIHSLQNGSSRPDAKQMSITSLLADDASSQRSKSINISCSHIPLSLPTSYHRQQLPPPSPSSISYQRHPLGVPPTSTSSFGPLAKSQHPVSPNRSVGTAPPLPMTLSTSLSLAAASPSCEYHIRVRQQPMAARSCGFGERDRRVIDPPPIVELMIDDPNATPEAIRIRLRFMFTVMHCSIWNETGEQDNSAMPEDYRQQRRLMGTLVSSPFVGQDENGQEGCFFCFPDLSCRTPGAFRLKFALVVLDPLGMRAGGSSPVQAVAMSEVFTVYNAKDFPGMQASTPLTKRLKEQGCLISIKKGNDKTNTAHGRDDSEEDGNGNGGSAGEGGRPAKGRKRSKRT